jgi:hypothetical protein
MSGRREPKLALVRKLASATAADERWLLTGRGPAGRLGPLTFLAIRMTAGDPQVAFPWSLLSARLDLKYASDIICHAITDNDMSPTLRAGDLVVAVERSFIEGVALGERPPDGIYLLAQDPPASRQLIARRLRFLDRGIEVSCDNPKAPGPRVLGARDFISYVWKVELRVGRP